MVLAVSAAACGLDIRGATLSPSVLTVTADAALDSTGQGSPSPCPSLTSYVALDGRLLPPRFSLVTVLHSSSTTGLAGPSTGAPVEVVIERPGGAPVDYLTLLRGEGSGVPPSTARQVVGDELIALDADSAAVYVGAGDLLTEDDVVLELRTPDCTTLGPLELVGATLLVFTMASTEGSDPACPGGGDALRSTVVIERWLLPQRFDVVFAFDPPTDGPPSAPVPIELTDDAPPPSEPPRDLPIRVLGTVPGEGQVGLASDLERLRSDGVAVPEPGELALGIAVTGCPPRFSSARYFEGKVQLDGEWDGPSCPATTTTYLAVPRAGLSGTLVIRGELDRRDPTGVSIQLLGPLTIDLGPP